MAAHSHTRIGHKTMSMLHCWRLIGCIALTLAATAPTWAQKSDKKARAVELGEMLGQSCMACHGTRGASTQQSVPIIGGQNDVFLAASMKAYRDGTRPSTVMERIAKAYSIREIEALAAYFSTQPFLRPPQETDPEKVTRGQAIHGSKCKKCHLHDGRDTSETDSPLLAGQKLEYLQRNMAEILDGKRAVEIKMDAALKEITRDEIEATLHFYAAQQGELR
jgi:sulfide dehydrogenase cytochrome subunit